jgi:transposase
MLFELPPAPPAPPPDAPPRLRRAQRNQVELRLLALDHLLPEDHEARTVWTYVEQLDLQAFLQPIRAVQGRAGRDATDPKILLALWLFATLQGVGSARALDALCQEHLAYQWLAGGVSLNYHTLADFRVDHAQALDDLLTQSVAVLRHEGLISLEQVAQDGIRVRASAGSSSFHRETTLQGHLQEAQAQVAALKAELAADPAGAHTRQQQARLRAAQERQERVQQALEHLPEVAAKKPPAQREQARASTTDADAHFMKMADGGCRPAYNFQYATTTASQVIIGVDVHTTGSDLGQMLPLVQQIQERYNETPQEMLADGNFAKHDDITALAQPEYGITVYSPVKGPNNKVNDRYTPKPTDSPAVAAWRQRMATAAAQGIYKLRAATAECVNALARNRGLQHLRLRGLTKVKCIALWYAVAHNLKRALTLRAGAVAGGARGS